MESASSLSRRLTSALIFALLCGLAVVSLLEAAASRSFWLDEFYGVQVNAIHETWRNLFVTGASSQGSPHPLYYMLEKLWLTPWEFMPQRWWNVNLFFRFGPIGAYALTGGFIFLFGERFLGRLWPSQPAAIPTLVAAALALFFFNVQFAQYYAIEARPYSLWLLFTTLHLLLTLEAFERGWGGMRFLTLYGLASFFLCATASPGLFQLWISFVAIQLVHRKLRVWPVLLAPTLMSLFYAVQATIYAYPPGTYADYLGFMKEVAYKSFHARSGFVFYPILALSLWKLWSVRRSRAALAAYFFFSCLFVLSFVLCLACWHRGFLLASRQYIYLVPLYLCLYFAALMLVAELVAPRLKRWLPKAHPSWILAVWAAVIVGKSVPELTLRAWKLPEAAAKWNFHGENAAAECTKFLNVPNEQEWDALNKRCRGLAP